MELDEDSPSDWDEDDELLDVSSFGVAKWQRNERNDSRNDGSSTSRRRRDVFHDILSMDSSSQYDDFHTIDWVRDIQKYRNQRKDVLKAKKGLS